MNWQLSFIVFSKRSLLAATLAETLLFTNLKKVHCSPARKMFTLRIPTERNFVEKFATKKIRTLIESLSKKLRTPRNFESADYHVVSTRNSWPKVSNKIVERGKLKKKRSSIIQLNYRQSYRQFKYNLLFKVNYRKLYGNWLDYHNWINERSF